MRIAAMAFCAMLAAAAGARAAECPDQTQSGLDACADAAYREADAALNGAYREIMRRLKGDADAARLLAAAEKAWIAYRDAECAFASSAEAGGSIYPMVVSICLEGVTKERTRELGAFLQCAEGDTGCPVPGK